MIEQGKRVVGSQWRTRWELRWWRWQAIWRERRRCWFYIRSRRGKSKVYGRNRRWLIFQLFNGCKDGLGGDGFVVDGGRSPSTSSKDGEDGEVVNKSLMGSWLIATGEIVVERLSQKLVELPMCSTMVERMVHREEKEFLD
ncbi:hypothetical protein Tco_1450660 [Tanacetum coccineum]